MRRHQTRVHEAVDDAMARVRRKWFLPPEQRSRADFDGPLPIGHGATNSQPRTVVDMLCLLEVEPGQRVLDVGAGSGWTTALLAHLVGPTGLVIGVEVVPELTEFARVNVEHTGMSRAEVRQAEQGRLGSPQHAPFHRILFSAMASHLPMALFEQLADHGIMVGPVDGQMTRTQRRHDKPHTETIGRYVFVPLIE